MKADKKMETALTNDRLISGREDAAATRTNFDEIYALYKVPVFRFACSLTGNAREAEDLFQDTWVRVVASFPGNPDLRSFKAWILGLVRFRKRRKSPDPIRCSSSPLT